MPPKEPLDQAAVHEFWRMELLDELHQKLEAIDWQPSLDPDGKRRAALQSLIARFEEIEGEELRNGDLT